MWSMGKSISTTLPTKHELISIPKSFLLKFCKNELHLWEELLPEKMRSDLDIQQHFICTKHEVNFNQSSSQLDLPYFIKMNCPYCKKEDLHVINEKAIKVENDTSSPSSVKNCINSCICDCIFNKYFFR